jgi:hypothetical protein
MIGIDHSPVAEFIHAPHTQNRSHLVNATMTKSRTSRLIGATAASILCAAAFAGLSAAPAQAWTNTIACSDLGGTVVSGDKCVFIGSDHTSQAAATADLPNLKRRCEFIDGKAEIAYAEKRAGQQIWHAVVQCA